MMRTRKWLSAALAFLMILTAVLCLPQANVQAAGKIYYVSSSTGNDSWPGTASRPWKTLKKVSSTIFNAGDTVLLKRGDVWKESVRLHIKGASTLRTFTLSNYGNLKLARPKIVPGKNSPYAIYLTKFFLDHPRFACRIANLELSTAKIGIFAENALLNGFTVENCYIHHMTGIQKNPATGIPEQNTWYSTGVRVFGFNQNVTVRNCFFDYCDVGLEIWTTNGFLIDNCKSYHSGYFGMEFYACFEGMIKNCTILYTGQLSMSTGTTGIEFDGGTNITLKDTEIAHSITLCNIDGCGVDYEGGTHNVITQNCYIHDNQGRAFLIMGSPNDPQDNIKILNNRCINNGTNNGNPGEPAFIMTWFNKNSGYISGNTIVRAYKGQPLNKLDNEGMDYFPVHYTVTNNTVIDPN